MAKHERVDFNKKSIIKYISNENQTNTAKICKELLDKNEELKVWETQYSDIGSYTCWYVSFNSKEMPWILNITIYKKNFEIEFRHLKYLDKNTYNNSTWQNINWKKISYKKYTDKQIINILTKYVNEIREDFFNNKVKQGGTSFAEQFIADIIRNLYKKEDIDYGQRYPWLKSQKNRNLQLDIFIKSMNLAIEIQGPQHYFPIWGKKSLLDLVKTDKLKKKKCKNRSIKLLWMDVNRIYTELIRLSEKQQQRELKVLINDFKNSNNYFLHWRNITDVKQK